MADSKISALTALTGANTDVAADVIAIVDTSVTTTKKQLVSELAIAVASNINGLVDISGAAGGQIKFPATQNASADANTLDDYEEGTWTPALTFATAGNLSVAYSTQAADYTKIGRVVFLNFNIITSTFTWTTSSGHLRITGVPFTSKAGNPIFSGSCTITNMSKAGYTWVNCVMTNGVTYLEFFASGTSATSTVDAVDLPTGNTVELRGSIAIFV